MAQGAFMGADGVKDLKSCYVGAGGVKAVKQIYVGQGGSVKLVWPSSIYNNGDIGTLGGGLTIRSESDYNNFGSYMYDTGSYLLCGVRSADSRSASSFYGAYCPDTIDASPYSTARITYTITKAASRSYSSSTNTRLYGSLAVFVSSYPFTFQSSTYHYRLLCNGSAVMWSSTSGEISTDYVSGFAYHLMSSSDSTNTTMTLDLNLSSYKSNIYLAVGVADGWNNDSYAIFTAQISEITLVV